MLQRFLFLSLIVIGFSAQSQELDGSYHTVDKGFAVDSRLDFGGRVYYNCDDVEVHVKGLLQKMGAQHVSVRCHGGIDRNLPQQAWEASLSLRYSALRLTESSEDSVKVKWAPVQVRTYDNCQLMTQVFNRVKSSFAIRNVKGLRSCGSINRDFRISFETLRPL